MARPCLALALGLTAAACGASGRAGSTEQSASSTVTVGHELNAFPSVVGLPATRLPAAPTGPKVERAYLTALFDDIQSVWRRDFTAAHQRYKPARLVVFYSVIQSACGKHDESGPFYCPGDDTVYLDLRFFSLLLGNTPVSGITQAYIIGHELGHNVQRLAGVSTHVDALNKKDPSREKQRSVQVELQADCLAGVWGRSAYPRSGFTVNDLKQALQAAHEIGDDYIRQAGGQVVDTSLFTHGTSEQRQSWLRAGYKSGSPGSCDTFYRG